MPNHTPVGRPYIAAAPASIATDEQNATVASLMAASEWAEPSWNADGTVEVAVLDYRGIIERIITVFGDGSTTTI